MDYAITLRTLINKGVHEMEITSAIKYSSKTRKATVIITPFDYDEYNKIMRIRCTHSVDVLLGLNSDDIGVVILSRYFKCSDFDMQKIISFCTNAKCRMISIKKSHKIIELLERLPPENHVLSYSGDDLVIVFKKDKTLHAKLKGFAMLFSKARQRFVSR
jgi:hypothetical protein